MQKSKSESNCAESERYGVSLNIATSSENEILGLGLSITKKLNDRGTRFPATLFYYLGEVFKEGGVVEAQGAKPLSSSFLPTTAKKNRRILTCYTRLMQYQERKVIAPKRHRRIDKV
ncbi:Uncharacterized protein Fot_02306 [Forsythia ovata]|uniref:Uncharacterized protein n=1 Tax=Forsythia ovata TaxID=205694 RepID=A0ABD1X6Z5_9LAMI